MPEWAKTIGPNEYIAIHSLRGAVDRNLRQAVHQTLINIAFPPDQIVQNTVPPFMDALLKYPDHQHILIIIEATRRHDLGTTIVLTTHNVGVIDNLNRRVITMKDGQVILDSYEGKYIL